jgi:hypothetical protein
MKAWAHKTSSPFYLLGAHLNGSWLLLLLLAHQLLSQSFTMQTMAIFAMKESVMGIRSYPFPIATKFDTICIAIVGHNHIHLHTYNAITPNLWFELLRVWKQLRGKCGEIKSNETIYKNSTYL